MRNSATRMAPPRGARRCSGQPARSSLPSASVSTHNSSTPWNARHHADSQACERNSPASRASSSHASRRASNPRASRTISQRIPLLYHRFLGYTRASFMALERFFRLIIARRWLVIAFYALLLPPAIWLALKVDQDNSIYRLIVPSDPDSLATAAFEKVFGRGEYVVLLAEAPDPFAPEVIKKVDDLSRELSKLPRVDSNSLTDIYRRAHAGLDATPAGAEAFKKFATGTDLFRKQGLVGPDYLGIPLLLKVGTNEERREVIASIDKLLAPVEQNPAPLT